MQRLTSLALLAAAVEGAVPTVELRNAAVPGTRYPMTGLGLAGPSTMPQCNVTRGDPFMIGDPEDANRSIYVNMIGPTPHC